MGNIATPVQSSVKAQSEPVARGLDYVEPVEDIKLETESDEPDDGLELLPLKRFFGKDAMDREYTKELNYIRDWGKEKGYDKDTLNEKLREIRYKIGNNGNTIRLVYQYIKIKNNIQDLVHKERLLEK